MTICTISHATKAVYRSSEHNHVPEGRLWTAVILRAMVDWQSSKRSGVPSDRMAAYFHSREFQFHCDLAGVNPEFVRETLAKVGKSFEAGRPGKPHVEDESEGAA